MDDFKVKYCSLCFSIAEDSKVIDATIRDVLDTLSLNPVLMKSSDNFVCIACFEKLTKALNFKSVCMDTEDNILTYINSKTELPINIEEVYKKQNEVLGESTQQVCRLCMHIIYDKFTAFDEAVIEMTSIFLAEINSKAVKAPVICESCLSSLKTHDSFIRDCLVLQKNVSTSNGDENQEFIKSEKIDIKSEPMEQDVVTEGREQIKEEISGQNKDNERNQPDGEPETKAKTEKIFIITTSHTRRNPSVHKKEAYKCSLCNYETKYIHALRKHLSIHRDPNTNNYKCTICGHQGKYLHKFHYHMLTHPEYSKDRMYECPLCDHKTKYKLNLKIHMQQHSTTGKKQKDPKVVKCDVCPYVSRYKKRVECHSLSHKKDSKVEWFQCYTCQFTTTKKKNLYCHITRGICKKKVGAQ